MFSTVSKEELGRLIEKINAAIETILTANIAETNQLCTSAVVVTRLLGVDIRKKEIKDFKVKLNEKWGGGSTNAVQT